MSRLNYNKWDALELSDDSDIEVHPNIDKKSMIRWKQNDIREKRQLRKLKLEHLDLENGMNTELLKRMRSLIETTSAEGSSFISKEVSRLRALVPDFDGKQFKDGEQPSQDHMVLALLIQVVNAVEKDGKGDEKRGERIVEELTRHERRLIDRQKEIVKEREHELAEQRKHITSEDMHVGFETKTMISNKPSAQPTTPYPSSSSKAKAKKTEEKIETINSPSVLAAEAESASMVREDSSDEEEVPELSGAALRFSKLKSLDFAACFAAISDEPSLLSEETTDALLVEAFSVAMKGDDKRARECVEKSLMIQYCLKLGRDGVSLYFKRMTSSDPKALQMFLEDVSGTARRIIDRAHTIAAEKGAERAAHPEGIEQIQLVASDPSTVITFEVPDGPPPENLEITGEGADELDPQLVREFLQRRWDIFTSFPKNLQTAIQEKNLEKVNKVLGKMSVDEAEEVVKNLQEGGILSFETSEIIDQTGLASKSGDIGQGQSHPTIKVPTSSTAGTPQSEPESTAGEIDFVDQLD